MKKNLLKIFFVLLIAVWTTCAYAEELVPVPQFDSTWSVFSSETGSGTVIPQGNTINLTATSTLNGGFYGALNKIETTGIAGMVATLNISKISGNCDLGIKGIIGQIGNNQVEVSIYLTQYNQLNGSEGSKNLQYDVKMIDSETQESTLIASGIFGAWNGGWVTGQFIMVAFARVGSEFWFYADGFNQVHTIQMLDGIIPLYGNLSGYVSCSQAQGANVYIAGSVSNIYLYYPSTTN